MGKILFITGFFPYYQGGAEYQALLLAEYLKKYHDISFVIRDHWNKCNGQKVAFGDFALYPIKPIKIKGISKTYLFETIQLYRILKKISPDIIYMRGATGYLGVAARYSFRYRRKLVWHIALDSEVQPFHINCINYSVPFDFIDYCSIQYGIKRANYIIGQTGQQQKYLHKFHNRSCNAIIKNWHPIPTESPQKSPHIVILWIANWKPFKQPEIFVKLAEEIGKKEHVRFVMLGRTGRYKQLVEEAKKNNIEIMGEIPNDAVNRLLAESHILINTSRQEGFSNTFIQAWLRRVPVVSLQVDPDNILQREQIGFCSGSFENLVQDTQRLIKDNELRNSMGYRARQYAMKNHSLDNMKKILEIFSSLLEKNSTTS